MKPSSDAERPIWIDLALAPAHAAVLLLAALTGSALTRLLCSSRRGSPLFVAATLQPHRVHSSTSSRPLLIAALFITAIFIADARLTSDRRKCFLQLRCMAFFFLPHTS